MSEIPSHEEVLETVRKIVIDSGALDENSAADEENMNKTLTDLGFDSLDFADIEINLEAEFDIDLRMESVGSKTIPQIVDFVRDKIREMNGSAA